MNGIDAIARILKLEGIEWLACYPNNMLIEAAAKEGIRPITFRHERGAVMAADGFSRISNRERFGVAVVQAQAGAENALGGIAQAFADNIPILVLPGGISLHEYGVRPNFSAVRGYGDLLARGESLLTPDQIGDVMRRAFNALRNGPAGPVLVELTDDVCRQSVDFDALNYRSPDRVLQRPTDDLIDAAAAKLLEADRPLLWAGAGVLKAQASEHLRRLSEMTAIPVFCTMPGKSAFDERHPLSLGAGSGATTLAAHRRIQSCDLLLALGSSLTRSPYGQSIPAATAIIHNTDNPTEINKDEACDLALVGDTGLVLEALIEAVADRLGKGTMRDSKAVAAQIAQDKAEWMQSWSALLESEQEPLSTYRVIHEIDRTLDLENSIVTHDAGAPRDSIVPFFTATVPHSYVGWGKTTHLGFGIPLMIGAKLAQPQKFCLNLMGDGAFGMSGMDLETSVRAGVPITTVLLNNGGMATYPGGFPTARERFGVSNMLGDYAAHAQAMGAEGIKVEKPKEMAPALEQAKRLNADGKTVLIDVHSDMEGRRSRWDR